MTELRIDLRTEPLAPTSSRRAGGATLERASPASRRFWRALWTTFRPYLAFVSGGAALVGLAFSSAPSTRAAIAWVPLFLSYGFGQALTDCFQTDTDALSAPYRPLVRGVVSRAQVATVSVIGLGASAALLTALNPIILIPAALAVGGLLVYTPLKRTWWGGPPCNAVVVALLPVMGRLVDGAGVPVLTSGPHALAFWAGVAAVLLGYGDFVVLGYLKDVTADRATGYHTFAVAFGWRPAVICGEVLALGALAAAAAALAQVGAGALAWTVLVASATVSVRAHATAHVLRDERSAHGPIVGVVRSFVLCCGAVVLGVRPEWAPALALLYALFELALRSRPERTQV
jgi:4-hydroxybenzoate polyprenyltransferase